MAFDIGNVDIAPGNQLKIQLMPVIMICLRSLSALSIVFRISLQSLGGGKQISDLTSSLGVTQKLTAPTFPDGIKAISARSACLPLA
jgi:hypothetical protein